MYNYIKKLKISTSPYEIWQLIWPQILIMYLQFFIGFTDVWVAGQLGANVQSAFGIVFQCVLFSQIIATAISSGGVATVSQSIGAGLHKRAKKYIVLIIMGSFCLGCIVATLGRTFGSNLFTILQIPNDILPIATDYWTVSLLTLPASYMFISTSAMFRAAKKVMPLLFVSLVLCITNLVGNLGFGLGYFGFPSYGYIGIAWTTFFCFLLGSTINCILLYHYNYLNKQSIPSFRWAKKSIGYLLKVSLPAGASQTVWQSGYLVLFGITASLPTDNISALAGLTAGMRIEALLFLPAFAFNATASVLVGNLLGAGNKEEAKSMGIIITATASLFISTIALCLWPFIDNLANLLSSEPKVQEQIVQYLYYNLIATPFTVSSMVMGGVMVGAGATIYNLMVFGSTFWLIRIPVAWLFGHIIWQSASGIFMAMLVSQVVQTFIMTIVLFKVDWARFAMTVRIHK